MSAHAWRRRRNLMWVHAHDGWRPRSFSDPSDQHPRWKRRRPVSNQRFRRILDAQLRRWGDVLMGIEDPS